MTRLSFAVVTCGLLVGVPFAWGRVGPDLSRLPAIPLATTVPVSAPSGVTREPPPRSTEEGVGRTAQPSRDDEQGVTLLPHARSLDHHDPWPSAAHVTSGAPLPPSLGSSIRELVARKRALDVSDPWLSEIERSSSAAAHSARGGWSRADIALRAAIQAALEAGDLDRAARLLDVLRGTRREP